MPRVNIEFRAVSARLQSGIAAAVFAFGVGMAGQAVAGSVTEVTLASPAQALAYCKAGSLPKGSTAYFNGTAGAAQFGGKKCSQAVPKKKVTEALQVSGSTVSVCKLATAKEATKLCNAGGIGEWDIDYIAGGVATVIGGPGYGCGTSTTTGGIGNAVCQ